MSMSKSLFRIYFNRKLGHTYVQGFHFIFCNNTSEHRKYAYLPVSGAPRSRTLLSAPEEPHLAPLLLVADLDTVNAMNLNRKNWKPSTLRSFRFCPEHDYKLLHHIQLPDAVLLRTEL